MVKTALVTLHYNEIELSQFFFRHYDPIVDHYVIYDDQSDDGSREILEAHPRVELRDRNAGHIVDDTEHIRIKEETCAELLQHYDWVIVVDFDEFLQPRDNTRYTLRSLLERYQREGVNWPTTYGFDMIDDHVPTDGVLTEQLRCGVPNSLYSKYAIVGRGVQPNYASGCHTAKPIGKVVESKQREINLLHYKYMSQESVLAESRRCKISKRNNETGQGWTKLDGKPIKSTDYWPLWYKRAYPNRRKVFEMPRPDYSKCTFTMESWPDKAWSQFDDLL